MCSCQSASVKAMDRSYAVSCRAMVTGNNDFLSLQLADMSLAWHQWDGPPFRISRPGCITHYKPVWDTQELSRPRFVADPDGMDWDLRKNGPNTSRRGMSELNRLF
ncbi:hypothetical protein F5Y17DRAFT_413744 [Xylariaceae sp. FL0594]|nr:hypothetical protein F5Y17DRAFT_413744 [Xylariaceae sp. FL0594]